MRNSRTAVEWIREKGTQSSIPGGETTLFVFDRITRELFGGGVSEQCCCVLSPGEQHKTVDSLRKIVSKALEIGLSRDGRIIGVGGGVVCDIAGLAASLYMRGCGLSLVPTTLLAMVDAAIGGKTAVDYEGYKNLIGSFYPAEEIYLFSEVLETQSESDFINGLAEVIKHGFLGDNTLLLLLKNKKNEIIERSPIVLDEMIDRAVTVKGEIVQRDLEERGIREHLNFGHTFAHALETSGGFETWSHGAAVGWGMIKAFQLGMLLGITDKDYAVEGMKLLRYYGYSSAAEAPADTLLKAMEKDKKKRSGVVRFVLQRGPQDTRVLPVERERVKEVLE